MGKKPNQKKSSTPKSSSEVIDLSDVSSNESADSTQAASDHQALCNFDQQSQILQDIGATPKSK